MTPGALTPSSWLETKLLLPRPRPLAVGRPRLEQTAEAIQYLETHHARAKVVITTS